MFKLLLAGAALSWLVGLSVQSVSANQGSTHTSQVPSPKEDLAAETHLGHGIELPAKPPAHAYAVTGELLPPFLKAVLSAWNREFGATPLTNNSVIFVIDPEQFYGGLESQQKAWLMSREMLGIRNFPVIVNRSTPNDDWYKRAQDEWKRGNSDAIDVVLTSLFHEMAHTQHAGGEREAYREQLALFERFRTQGRLSSPYAHTCYALLRNHYRDLTKHPERYRRVLVNIQDQSVALLVQAQDAPLNAAPVGHK
jgi:hypothetical protein